MNATGKKKGGGFLSRQAKKDKTPLEPITEDELLRKETISPDEVLRLQKISESKYRNFK